MSTPTRYPWPTQWARLAHGLGLHPGTPVAIALSGGADSVFLLHLIARAEARPKWIAIHVDHGLRGEASIEDAAFCARLCARLGAPFARRRLEIADGPDLEARLRKARYAALLDETGRAGIDVLLTGHHEDDALETLLMRMMRGGELGGLTGPARETILGRADGRQVRVLRPLLHMRREEVRALLRAEGLEWREDGSNDSARFTRNRVRGSLLPAVADACGLEGVENLRRFAGAVEGLESELANRTAHICWDAPRGFEAPEAPSATPSGTSSGTSSAPSSALGPERATATGAPAAPERAPRPGGPRPDVQRLGGSLPRATLTALAPPLQRRALVRLLVEGTGHAPSREVLETVQRDLSGGRTGRTTLPGAWMLQLRADRLHLTPGPAAADAETEPRTARAATSISGEGLALGLPGRVLLPDGRTIVAELVAARPEADVPRDACEVELDAAGLPSVLRVRNPRPGDRFHPLGAPGHRPLGRFLADAGVARELRGLVPLVFAGEELVWVAGLRPCEARRVRPTTGTRVRLRLEPSRDAAPERAD